MVADRSKNFPLILAVLCFAVYAFVGMIVLDDYGITWDEDAQLMVGRNHLEYLQTGDSDLLQFGSNKALPHYGAAFPVAVQIASRFSQDVFGLHPVDAQHLLIFLSSLGILISVFGIARRLFSDRVAVFTVLFLALFPRFFGHSFYNPKDIPVVAFVTVTLLFVYRALEKRSWKDALAAGIVFGCGLASLVTTILGLPILLGLYVLYRAFNSERSWRATVRKDILYIVLFILVTAATTFLLWPTLWSDPLFFIDAVQFFLHHRWDGDVLYLGTTYTSTTLPWHYAPLFLIISTPFFILVAALIGGIIGIKEFLAKKNLFRWCFLVVWICVPLALFIKPGAVNYDGIRHFFVVIPPIMIAAAVGLDRLLQWLVRRTKSRQLSIVIAVVIFFWLFIEMARVHPFQGAYFNEVTRLTVPDIHNTFETDYWAASYRQAVEWIAIAQHSPTEIRVCTTHARHLLKAYARDVNIRLDCQQPQYTIVLTRGGQQKRRKELEALPDAWQVHSITKQNTTYALVFEHGIPE